MRNELCIFTAQEKITFLKKVVMGKNVKNPDKNVPYNHIVCIFTDFETNFTTVNLQPT